VLVDEPAREVLGQAGLTDAVLTEIGFALNCHELIKIKIRAEKDERSIIVKDICEKTGASLIQTIGQIAVIYRKKPPSPVKAKQARSFPNKLKPARATKHKPIIKRSAYHG
jgi:RNA-binding protein